MPLTISYMGKGGMKNSLKVQKEDVSKQQYEKEGNK